MGLGGDFVLVECGCGMFRRSLRTGVLLCGTSGEVGGWGW